MVTQPVESVWPEYVSLGAPSAHLAISGAGFEDSPLLTCRLGGVPAPGMYASDTSIGCEVALGLLPGFWDVDVSNDGENFTRSGVAVHVSAARIKNAKRFMVFVGEQMT
eukprot:jgi/Mesvir1/5005/Mv13893-RA.1